jgi:hypothetical protein
MMKCYQCGDQAACSCDICDKQFCDDHGTKNFFSARTGEVSFCESCGSQGEDNRYSLGLGDEGRLI